ncbi:putative ATP-grasp-modified RiPP [Thermopolyspora sp. NPDC052614]|uniref:putative ATP-grasp-modified RiPP n=1 Tax=Thermopolyspora sp. NPDC052614 TaxID=3155682 RepID=UPI00343CE74A
MTSRDPLPLRPWGATRMTRFAGDGRPAYASVELNPDTQVARYFDVDGRLIRAGKHGTNKPQTVSQPTGGSKDGENPAPLDDVNVTQYVPD